MNTKFEKATTGERVSAYIYKRRIVFITIISILIAAIALYSAFIIVNSNLNGKGLMEIDDISYKLTEGSSSISEEELEKRKNDALTSLNKHNSKSGIIGVRANMLCAEIVYSQKKYDEAAEYWIEAAKKGKKSYTVPLSYFNAGVCYENKGDIENAEMCYKKSSENSIFLVSAHAQFSLGRIMEEKNKYQEAYELYNRIFSSNPDTSWAKLAKSRILSLEAENKITK